MVGRMAFALLPVLAALGLVGAHLVPCDVLVGNTPASAEAPLYPSLPEPMLIRHYCGSCHSSGRAKIDLDGPIDRPALRQDKSCWETVVGKLRSGEMPPPRYPQPAAEERERIVLWLEQQLASLEPAESMAFRVRRLRQVEYRNAVRDVFGVQWQPPADCPADDPSWDLVHEIPALPPALVAHYESAADAILASANFVHPSALATCDGATDVECARKFVLSCARLAFRRSLTAEEETALAAAVDKTAGNPHVKAALKIVLTSPHFLYRIEPRPTLDPSTNAGPCREAALASRLSHLLWSSAPDEELLALADAGLLGQQLDLQMQRMLKDPRARALVDDFALGWLGLQNFHDAMGVSPELIRAMREETQRFVECIVREDRSVLEFLDANYTFVNEALAQHYGIAGVSGEHFRKVHVAGTARGGLLTQASILTLTSQRQTSPVMRGKWVLTNLLGTPPPPPPSDLLEGFEQSKKVKAAGSARQLLEMHRSHASCLTCHAKIDGLGLPLENFDATGRWRANDDGSKVDASAVMPDGSRIDGPIQLKAYLLSMQDLFIRNLAGKLLSHALGRKLADSDGPALDVIVTRVVENQCRFSTLVLEVILSKPFQKAWGEPEL